MLRKPKTMDALRFKMMFCLYMLALSSQNTPIAAYTLTSSQSVRDGQTLISQGGMFELGFFSPSNTTKNRYMGIWYKRIPVQTVIWVANRESPVPDTSGVMKIDKTGNIVVLNGTGSILWSSHSSKAVENPIVELMESGNLVLRNGPNSDPHSYIWQSFDYPGDTWMPGMKLGWEFKTGLNRYLSSWRNFDDPSSGDFTYGFELAGYPQIVTRKGSNIYYRSGSWNGIRPTGSPELKHNPIITNGLFQNAEEYYVMFQLINQSVMMRTVLGQSGAEGHIQLSIWNYKSNNWVTTVSAPRDVCDKYAQCGVYSTCTSTSVAVCQCLKGFKPKSPYNWRATDWSQGCEREVPLNCSSGEGFRRYTGVKLPDTSSSRFNMSMTLDLCRVSCLNNCSCQAYANANTTGDGSGCIMWFTDLVDIKQFGADGQDLYVRMPASELDFEGNSRRKKTAKTIVIVTSIAGVIVLSLGSWYIWKKVVSKGMKIGWNLKAGLNRYLSSWRNSDDPSRGDFTFGIELTGYPQFVTRKGSKMYYRAGSWNGIRATGTPELEPNSIITYEVVQNAEEYTMMFQPVNRSVLKRAVLGQSGTESRFQSSIWNYNTNTWVTVLSTPRDICDEYAQCGNNSICTPTNVAVCQCLKGFKPKSPNNWRVTDWSQGCEREVLLNCSNGEGFRRFTEVKLPDTSNSWFNMSMTLDQCRVSCLNNCSCQAYVNANIKGGGSGCIIWYTDLIDIKQLGADGQDLYVRMPASELDFEANSRKKKAAMTTVIVTSIAGVIVLSLGSLYIWKIVSKGSSKRNDFELPLYSLGVITAATAKFSRENKLGEGGFGPVYKGKLEGQDIAVKRLSKDSSQGVDAFKNEVILISKLQHKNLVRLVGCCIEGEEKMLVYEYMQNNSLDSFVFDETKRSILDWQKRFQIIQGIAGGLLYLHQESRLRIIHRDLKASNILLDSEMVPKISDFGMARIFGGDQVEAKTRRVVGTYGYMSPEYVIDGKFSVKSDVFSFGVLVLEIISGKKNWGFRHAGHDLNLIGHAWTLWNEDRSSEFVDGSMTDTYCVQDVLRCVHIGLLCVQKETEQRPTMSTVVIMLSSETAVLPKPQRPGFFMERTPLASSEQRPCNSNEFTITMVEGR